MKQFVFIFFLITLSIPVHSNENCFTKITSVMAQGKFVSAGNVIDFNKIKMPARGGLCGPTCAVNLAEYFRVQLKVPPPYTTLEEFEFDVLRKLQGQVSFVLKGLTSRERHKPISTALKLMGLEGWRVRKVTGEHFISKKDITREGVQHLSGSMISLRATYKQRAWYHFMLVADFNPNTNQLVLIEPGFPKFPVYVNLKRQLIRTSRGVRQRYKIEYLNRSAPSGRTVYPKSAIIETAVIVDFL